MALNYLLTNINLFHLGFAKIIQNEIVTAQLVLMFVLIINYFIIKLV